MLAQNAIVGRANENNAHCLIGLIDPTLILSRRYRSKEKHPVHPGETMGLLGRCEASGQDYGTPHWGVSLHSPTLATCSDKRFTDM